MTLEESETLKEFILFARDQKIQRFTLGDFSCELPAKDVNQAQLETMQKEIDALRSVTARLTLAVEAQTRGISHTPFTDRIKGVKNG